MNYLLRLLRQVPPLLTGFVHSLLPCTSRSSGLGRDQRLVTINLLPDDVLLEIFFHVTLSTVPLNWYLLPNTLPWNVLVHVCRRWRYLVFASARHLNLRPNYCAYRPMSVMPDVWSGLPLTIRSARAWGEWNPQWDNMLAALESEHYKRFCEIHIELISKFHWKRFAAAMQKPFPELTHLSVWTRDRVSALPDSFLGGSAPRLRELKLINIPFPSMPTLLVSAKGLVILNLSDIPDSGYFSPDAMATALTVMTTLEFLRLQFESPRSRPDPASRLLPPHTRFVLPALTEISFKGDSEYLEVLLARIDAPHLYDFLIQFFMGLDFDVPQLHRFIRHTEVFNTIDYAEALLCWDTVHLNLYPNTAAVDPSRQFALKIDCDEFDGQLSSLAQVCRSFTSLISTVEVFKIREEEEDCVRAFSREANIEDTRWLNLLDPFTGLKDLYLTSGVARHVCDALRNLSRQRAAEVSPALRSLFVPVSLLQSVQETMTPFVAARQLSGHPVVIDHWKGDSVSVLRRLRFR